MREVDVIAGFEEAVRFVELTFFAIAIPMASTEIALIATIGFFEILRIII